MAAWQDEPIDGVWVDCYHAMWLDNILAGAIVVVLGYMAVRMTIVAIQTAVQCILLVWHMYTILSYLSLAVEQTVVLEKTEKD